MPGAYRQAPRSCAHINNKTQFSFVLSLPSSGTFPIYLEAPKLLGCTEHCFQSVRSVTEPEGVMSFRNSSDGGYRVLFTWYLCRIDAWSPNVSILVNHYKPTICRVRITVFSVESVSRKLWRLSNARQTGTWIRLQHSPRLLLDWHWCMNIGCEACGKSTAAYWKAQKLSTSITWCMFTRNATATTEINVIILLVLFLFICILLVYYWEPEAPGEGQGAICD